MTISGSVSAHANNNPYKIAVKHGDVALSYSQLNRRAAQLARFLIAQGLQPNDVVAIATNRTPEMIILFLALIKAGITYLPIDRNFPADRITYMLKDASVILLLKSSGDETRYEGNHHEMHLESALKRAEKYSDKDLEAPHDPEGVAYILYTSGSTGLPKGVQVKRAGILNLLEGIQQSPGITADDNMLFTTTISFDIAELEILLPLVAGATLVIAGADVVKDGRALLDMARNENISIMQGAPFMWRMMLEAGWADPLPIKVFCGGEAMSRELAEGLLPRCNQLWNMYGPTETTVYSIIKRVMPGDEVITIGKAIKDTQVYLLDEQLNIVPNGEVGEIYIGGTGVARGYLNKPELTAERFIDDKFTNIPGEKIYRTGDLGKLLPNGDTQCLGRIDHQIKIRGYRIEAEEIEAQLKLHPGIINALVTLYTDDADNMHLVAYVVPRQYTGEEEAQTQVPDWKEHLARVLPEYMIPDIFMPIPAIPVLENGKTNRKALPQPILYRGGRERYVEPKTDTERALALIFLNNIAIDRIGLLDNFFQMGIDSLVMVKIMVQIEREFGKRYPLSILINYPNLNQLAWLIDNEAVESEYKSLIPIRPKGNKIPLYIVHGIGLNLLNMYHMVSMLDAEQPVYGLQALGLDGSTDKMDSIEEIARFYNSEILQHDPVGPYAISGYSFGGYIAFEMVRQLREMGKEVKMLAMFDTNLQLPTHSMATWPKWRIKIMRQFKKLLFRIGTFITKPIKTIIYLLQQIPVYYYQFLNLIGISVTYNPNQVPAYMQHIMQHLQKVFKKYTLKPQDVKLQLFKAAQKLYYVDDPQYFGWNDLALKGVDVHVVPGDHREMFIAPNDKYLAEALQRELDKIN